MRRAKQCCRISAGTLAIHRAFTPQGATRARQSTMRATSSPRFSESNRTKLFSPAAEPNRAIWRCSVSRDRRSPRGGHIISSKTEHHAVLNAVEHLEKHEGFEVTWLNVSSDGIVDLDQLAKSIRPETRLVSIMTANNETGVIQPMREISEICREHGVLVAQRHGASVRQNRDVDLSLVDAASFAAHKFYGPKGARISFSAERLIDPTDHVRRRARKRATSRDRKRRRDCRNGGGRGVDVARSRGRTRARRATARSALDADFQKCFQKRGKTATNAPRLANTLNVSLLGLDSEMLLIALDLEGVCASSGSACMVGSVVASHVLLAMGLPMETRALGGSFLVRQIDDRGRDRKQPATPCSKIVERLQTRKSAYAVA